MSSVKTFIWFPSPFILVIPADANVVLEQPAVSLRLSCALRGYSANANSDHCRVLRAQVLSQSDFGVEYK